MIARWLVALLSICALPAGAQQNLRVPVGEVQLAAQLYRPAGTERRAAVAIFHGCGGPGQNTARMAGLLRDWGYVALAVDSFSARGMVDVCGKHWPTQAEAEVRASDIDASVKWLAAQSFVDPARIAFMGYSYGGGVALLRTLTAKSDDGPAAKAAILVYPDCALAEPLGTSLRVRQPAMFALGALDDWTPVSQCKALLDRVTRGRELVETHVYEGAHHSFDALGLPVRYLPGVGNRSKPGGCCGAHYGANEPAWKAFVADVKDFLGRRLIP